MRIVMLGLLVFVPSLPAGEQPKPETPREGYEALLKEYEAAEGAWHQRYDEAPPTDLVKRYEEWPEWSFLPRFLHLAEENPKDPAAADALLWVVGLSRGVGDKDKALYPSLRQALETIAQDHLQDERVVQKCLDLANGCSPPFERFFRAVLGASRDRTARGRAGLALARCLKTRAAIAQRPWFDHVEGIPMQSYMASRLDPDYVRVIRTADPVALNAEAEAMLERVTGEFGDIKDPRGRGEGTLAEAADAALSELRNLAIGKVAPEIEGKDLDGRPMRLSEYRGKVVAVVFWATWCGPCMGMVPHERSLVQRLKDEPFVLLGVNLDEDRDRAKEVVQKEGMTWRSWWDRGGSAEPIASKWNIAGNGIPQVYVLDQKGVIRFKNVREKLLDDAVDTLMREMAVESRSSTPASHPGE